MNELDPYTGLPYTEATKVPVFSLSAAEIAGRMKSAADARQRIIRKIVIKHWSAIPGMDSTRQTDTLVNGIIDDIDALP